MIDPITEYILIKESGKVKIEYKNVLWDSIQDYYGSAGVLCGAYVYGEFISNSAKRALVLAKDISQPYEP